jgi:hypothetical protein
MYTVDVYIVWTFPKHRNRIKIVFKGSPGREISIGNITIIISSRLTWIWDVYQWIGKYQQFTLNKVTRC